MQEAGGRLGRRDNHGQKADAKKGAREAKRKKETKRRIDQRLDNQRKRKTKCARSKEGSQRRPGLRHGGKKVKGVKNNMREISVGQRGTRKGITWRKAPEQRETLHTKC